MLQTFLKVCRCGFYNLRCFLKLFFHLFVVCNHIVTGQCFDTAHTGCNTALRKNLKCLDLCSILYMCTATELSGELSHGNDSDFLSVLFAKQSHCPGLLCLINGHDIGTDFHALVDLFIDHVFHFLQLFRSHGCKVGEIESGTFTVLIRTRLLDMCTQHFTECFLQ